MDVAAFPYYRDLIRVLVAKDFRVRYRSTVLGYAWSVLHPLAFAVVFFFVFKTVMRIEMPDYALFLITGLFPWQCFSNSLNASNFFFLGNGSLIKKVRFPRALLVLAGVLNDQIHFAISIPVVVAFMLCHRVYPSLCWLYGVPLLVAVQLLFTYALCLLVATLNVFFRDLERLTAIFTMILFYLTPIFYPATMIPAGFRWAFYLNPVAAIITAWRGLFLEGTVDLPCYGLALGFALAAFAVAQAVYGALEWRLAELV